MPCPEPGEAMRRWESALAMRRRSHRIRIGRIATALSALGVLAAPVVTQAQNVPRVGWIFSGASALNPPKLAIFQGGLRELGYVEDSKIGNNRAGKISSAAGSGGKRYEPAPIRIKVSAREHHPIPLSAEPCFINPSHYGFRRHRRARSNAGQRTAVSLARDATDRLAVVNLGCTNASG